MGFGTSNGTVLAAVNGQNDTQFKTVNNLLSLQDNHVEEFFQYHGEKFLTALEQLMEDVTERVISQMLVKLEFTQDSTTGNMKVHSDCLREYEKITQENIDLDIKALMFSAVDTEVIQQRKMAKKQYLESQGFSSPQAGGMGSQAQPQQIQQAQGQYGQAQQFQQQGQQAMNNGSGYPVPPSGQDTYGRPYWTDPQTGQMSYEPPTSGLHLGAALQKGAAWAKWLM
tara:strand:- start:159 stop:836 length:678 start_codon:yes stop_codon:yes gene_type:complete